jgi:hypothetical protein
MLVAEPISWGERLIPTSWLRQNNRRGSLPAQRRRFATWIHQAHRRVDSNSAPVACQ